MPPVSNVIPLPIRPSTGEAGAPSGSYLRTMTRGGSVLPFATPSSSPMPSCSILFSSSISTPRPAAFASSAARSAKVRGVSELLGSFASSRAMLLHSPSTRPRSIARSRSFCPDGKINSADSIQTRGSSVPVLYDPELKFARTTPSVIACAAIAGSIASCARPSTEIFVVRRWRAASAPAVAARRSRSVVNSLRGPTPTSATRAGRHPSRAAGVTNSS